MMMFATDSVNVYAPCPQGICLYGSFGPLRCLFVAYSLPVCPIHAPIANPYSPIQCASIHRTSGPTYDQLSGIAIHRQRQRPAQHQPAEPVHHCNQVQASLCHPDIGDIRAPYLVNALHRGSSQQVGVDPQEPIRPSSLLLVSTRSLRRSGPLKVMKFPVTADQHRFFSSDLRPSIRRSAVYYLELSL